MNTIRTLILSALMLAVAVAYGQSADSVRAGKEVVNAQMIGVGAAEILDTYLSPEKYKGTELRYISHTIRRRGASRWSRMLVHQGSFIYADNRSGNGGEMAGMYPFTSGLHHNWRFLGGALRVRAGGQADAEAGFVYNTSNGNNPAQARLALNIAPSAAAAYGFRLGRVPVWARYEASVPLFGLMFSPNYGQSYYEIFSRGDYDHNVVPTTFVCAPSFRQMFTLDFTFGRTTLRLGYLGDFRQAAVNNLKYHTYSNMLLIGFVRHFKLTRIIP